MLLRHLDFSNNRLSILSYDSLYILDNILHVQLVNPYFDYLKAALGWHLGRLNYQNDLSCLSPLTEYTAIAKL